MLVIDTIELDLFTVVLRFQKHLVDRVHHVVVLSFKSQLHLVLVHVVDTDALVVGVLCAEQDGRTAVLLLVPELFVFHVVVDHLGHQQTLVRSLLKFFLVVFNRLQKLLVFLAFLKLVGLQLVKPLLQLFLFAFETLDLLALTVFG